MKKLISFIILLALSISLFGCAKAPIDSASPDALIENKRPTDDAVQVSDETADQTPQENADGADADTELDDSATVTPAVKQNEAVKDEAVDLLPFTVEDKFNACDVAIVLTAEETAKNKTYTAADFEGYDIVDVIDYDCYPETYYGDYIGLKKFVLLIDDPSKERVLEYCEKLNKDPRIKIAEPNIDENNYKLIRIKLSENIKLPGKYNLEKIKVPGLEDYIIYEEYGWKNYKNNAVLLFEEPCDHKEYIENYKKILANENVIWMLPEYERYNESCVSIKLTPERYDEYINGKTLSIDEFPGFDVQDIIRDHTSNSFDLYLRPTKKIFKIASLLEENSIVEKTSVSIAEPDYDNDYGF